MISVERYMGVFYMLDKRKKLSIDFELETYELMRVAGNETKKSNSTLVNEILSVILSLSPRTKKKLRDFCNNMHYECMENRKEEMNYMQFNGIAAIQEMEQWKQLSQLFTVDEEEYNQDNHMRKVILKDAFCIFPDDWIVLKDICGKPEECSYAGVVECKNGAKYGINGAPVPHFIFFCNDKHASDYSDEMEAKIYKECAKAYPKFIELFNMQTDYDDVDIDWNNESDIKKAEAINKLPYFGLFAIPVKGEFPHWTKYNPSYTPPYGAMIIPLTKKKNHDD